MKAVGLTPGDLQDALTTMQKSAEGIIGQSVGKANEALQTERWRASSKQDWRYAAALKAGNSADMLVEWQDLSGNTHLSDALFHNAGAATASSTALKVSISDMVEVTGVIETGANLHLVA